MKKQTTLLTLFIAFGLSCLLISCDNTQDFQGFRAKITNVRTGKHNLQVIDVKLDNKRSEKVEVQTVAMDNNGQIYMPFDKELYDNSGNKTTVGLREVVLDPGSQQALTWIPMTKSGGSQEVSFLRLEIKTGETKENIILKY
jgi:hypothetical protein